MKLADVAGVGAVGVGAVGVGAVGVGAVGVGPVSQVPQVTRHAFATPSNPQRLPDLLATHEHPLDIFFPSSLTILSLNGESTHSSHELQVSGQLSETPSNEHRFSTSLLATQSQFRKILLPSGLTIPNLIALSTQDCALENKTMQFVRINNTTF